MLLIINHSRFMIFHSYNISSTGALIFYCEDDFLVFSSLLYVYSQRYSIEVVSLCLMRNHYHVLTKCAEEQQLIKFISSVQRVYVTLFNRKGKVRFNFKTSFGRDQKRSLKEIRNALTYIANNAVEKKQCVRAEMYRWNFLSVHTMPTNEEFVEAETGMSKQYRLIASSVRYMYRQCKSLTYDSLEMYRSKLTAAEYEHLVKYITRLFCPVDIPLQVSYFKDYSSMLESYAITTGSEYNVGEEYMYEDYRHYDKIEEILKARGILSSNGVICMKHPRLMTTIQDIFHLGVASELEVRRFFHIER